MALFGIGKKEVIYYPGCYSSAFLKSKIENYKKILKRIGVSFFVPDNIDMVCCGGILGEAGYERQLRKLAKENASFLEKKGIKKIITNCPLCLQTFKRYNEILPDFKIETEFILSTIINAIRDNDKLIRVSKFEPIVYYDSCYLSRYSDYTELPRELLRLLGYTLVEIPKYNREETICCGSCGNLPLTNPNLAEEIALKFLKKILKLKLKRIVTADIHSYHHLNKILNKYNIKDITLIEFSDIICDSFNITKEMSEEDNGRETEEESKIKDIIKQAGA